MVVELKDTHHLNDCDDMKMIIPNMQDGVLSRKEHSCVINGKEVKKANPSITKYATFCNGKRLDINAPVF
jgi:hypothetical protein